MTTVPSWVPIAAVATIVLGLFVAPWLARRQENGKLQANAEAELRSLVVDLRSDVVHAHGELHRDSTYVSDAFTGQPLIDFTSKVVGLARNLPPTSAAQGGHCPYRSCGAVAHRARGRYRTDMAAEPYSHHQRCRRFVDPDVGTHGRAEAGIRHGEPQGPGSPGRRRKRRTARKDANRAAPGRGTPSSPRSSRRALGRCGWQAPARRDPVATQSPRAPVSTARRTKP